MGTDSMVKSGERIDDRPSHAIAAAQPVIVVDAGQRDDPEGTGDGHEEAWWSWTASRPGFAS